MKALALTDAGNMYGTIEFYKTCKKAEIKPILGVDFYMAIRGRKDRQAGVDNRRTRLVLLAKNLAGYKNLIKLVTDSHLEGFYYKPRVDKELLEKYHDGLIAISPAWNSEISQKIRGDEEAEAEKIVEFYKKNFGEENFFLELTHHPEIEDQQKLRAKIIKFAQKTKTPLVAAHDVYYLDPEDRKARDTLTLVNTNAELNERNTFEGEGDFTFISGEQAEKFFKDIPEAISNTEKIAEMCNVELTLGKWVFADYKLPAGETHDGVLRKTVFEGIAKRGLQETKEVLDRIEYELSVIKTKGYATYFLTVSDLLRHAHENGILTTIRGSVAGSIVTYLAGITNINPIEYKLPFERFLNPERPSAPDIDMDYADNRRDEMIEYAKQKYGADKVAQIGTFGTMMARGSVRDVARALGFEYAIGDRISKLIPMGSQGFPMSIDRALEMVPELAEIYKKEKDVETIIDMAKKIEGCARHISVHAAGVVIAPTPLTDYTPVQMDPKGGKVITQYDMHAVEDAGLLKFDFLGIKNLSILADAVSLVEKLENKKIDIENIPLDDKKTFEMLAKGETIGLFQLNGSGMTKYLKDLRPSTIHDINAMVALYRPGPIESIPQYIERKHNPRLVKFLDPRMKDILDQSFGVITYQDDVMLIAIKLAGYSWLEADKLRKAMGKKIPAEMEAQKQKLHDGLIKNGMDEKKAQQLWTLIEPFAAYGFNKCLTGDTKIIDAKTGKVLTIKEIFTKTPSVSVLSKNQNWKIEKRGISKVMENGLKDVFELTTKTGRKIRATANHPFLTLFDWKNLEMLKEGDRIAIARTLELVAGRKNEQKKAAVLGYLLSEGNFCHPHGIYFYSSQRDEVEDFIKSALCFGNSKCTIDSNKKTMAVYCGQINPKNGNSLYEWISELGLIYKKATEKFIPETVFEWDKKSLSILLGKMWQGDGCVSLKNQQVYYATSSEKFAEQVAHLLLRFGIMSSIHTKKFKYKGGYKIGYAIIVCHRENLRRFWNAIGSSLIGNKKREMEKLAGLMEKIPAVAARGTKDTVPSDILKIIRAEMLKKNISVKKIAEETDLAIRLFSYDKKKIGYQREVVKIIGNYLGSKEILQYAESDIYWDEIVSIRKTGKEMTYDITVPEFHNFVANDIIVHNSHAASYGRVAYQTSFMKANFPVIYMTAVLTADSGDVEKIGEIIAECKRMNIPVLPPSINESFENFTVVKAAGNSPVGAGELPAATSRIRFGLTTIKNFGEGIAKSIIDERKQNGKFKSLADFLERIKDKNLNKKSLEALVKCGAMDDFGERGAMLANTENLLAYNKEVAKSPDNQDSLFGLMSNTSSLPSLRLEKAEPATATEKLAWEKELLGLYISGHPLDKFKNVLEKREVNISKVRETMQEGMIVVIGGLIEEARQIITKKNDPMMFGKVADLTGSIEVVFFPKVFNEFKNLLMPEKCIAIKGRISKRNGEVSIIAEKVKELV